MGHQRLGTLPDTAPWGRVVSKLAEDAEVAAVAAATTQAAARGLEFARDDKGLTYCFWLLAQLAWAARKDDFASALRNAGLLVQDEPDVFDIAASFSEAVDRYLHKARGRTDLGEMAQLAAVESLSNLLSQRAARLYESTPAEVHQAARELSTSRGFGTLAHDFFANFTQRFLTYHLGRELSLHVGGNGRFLDPNEHNEYVAQLKTHCREVAAIMREFAASWYSKAHSPRGKGGSMASARGFVNRTLGKLKDELVVRGERDVQ
jgi:hypothetical protein